MNYKKKENKKLIYEMQIRQFKPNKAAAKMERDEKGHSMKMGQHNCPLKFEHASPFTY